MVAESIRGHGCTCELCQWRSAEGLCRAGWHQVAPVRLFSLREGDRVMTGYERGKGEGNRIV